MCVTSAQVAPFAASARVCAKWAGSAVLEAKRLVMSCHASPIVMSWPVFCMCAGRMAVLVRLFHTSGDEVDDM